MYVSDHVETECKKCRTIRPRGTSCLNCHKIQERIRREKENGRIFGAPPRRKPAADPSLPKRCTKCNVEKQRSDFYVRRNGKWISTMCVECARVEGRRRAAMVPKEIRRQKQREWYRTPTGKAAKRRSKLKYAYGFTPEMIEAAKEAQGQVCAICRRAPTLDKLGRGWNVDHCHTTGKIRSMLCRTCNIALGSFHDNPTLLRAAADYIEKYRSV